ncbi:MAG: amino acid aminotransferase [Planctomycetes bacterium]|nr:amino acid aminotransferase [Planctomycetota bacterium]
MLMQIAMIQDRIVDYDELDEAYLDRGTYFGDGVYEVLRSYGGKIFLLEKHLERFARSLGEIGIEGVDIDEIREKIITAYNRASIDEAKVYFHITRGIGPRNHGMVGELKPNFFLTVTELGDFRGEKEHGIKVSTYPDLRWKRCDIKSLNLLPNVLARLDAEKKGCVEAILVSDAGEITEGSASAFFAVFASDKNLVTRPLGTEILPSITRKLVVQVAVNAGLTVVEKALTPWQAKQADELFIAVTTKDIVPVVEFDGVKIADGKPGEYTNALMKEINALVFSS